MTKITIIESPGKRAEIEQPNIVKVTARELFKGDGSSKGYRYTAHTEQGPEIVIRGHATRLYANAFLYDGIVATGKTGLASAFSFGKAPTRSGSAQVVTSFAITLESDKSPDWEAGKGGPCATTDDDHFARAAAGWLIAHEVPFRYGYELATGLHVLTVNNKPDNLKSAFDYARRIR
jgi:hypothetical protein